MVAKKKVLGRGLGALLQDMDTAKNDIDYNNTITTSIDMIDVSAIQVNPNQPRTEFNAEAIDELSESIKRQGIIVPITVTRDKKTHQYILIAGERRLRAAKQAGLTQIPAYIRTVTPNEMMEMALVENIQRENLDAIEIAIAIQNLIDTYKFSQEDLSIKLGKNRSTISNYLRLLKLPASIQLAIKDNTLSMGHARAIINIESEEQQLYIMQQIIDKGLSVRDVEKMVASIKEEEKTDKPLKTKSEKKPLPFEHSALKKLLSTRFGSQVEISRSKRGKGNIVIPFSNDKEFMRIASIIEGKQI
jgi:ParB-like partition proteins